ncbi:uncharacterized protein B0H64DRAFT_436371 [Chaetomium fimeti]|uniref:Uncharacterized protein n=1 Tax=Chaetomium fimeti TaxID=1854472 RepID=A0AAE0H6S8_9PEZI|nr:hypothetical protein B0H64DRAFT_436371 [Chaetomium fimeti]
MRAGTLPRDAHIIQCLDSDLTKQRLADTGFVDIKKPDILGDVLGPESDPTARPATIYGYELANRGHYRTLLDGASDATVAGCAFLVPSAEAAHRLTCYETNAYTLATCTIRLDGEPKEPLQARMFKYAGDARALKEGRFDRTLWERQMGQQLPQRSKS